MDRRVKTKLELLFREQQLPSWIGRRKGLKREHGWYPGNTFCLGSDGESAILLLASDGTVLETPVTLVRGFEGFL